MESGATENHGDKIPSDVFTPALLSITQMVTLKLSDSNYLSWKLQFEQFLNSQLLLGFVTGANPRPTPTLTVRNGDQVTETNNPAFLKWVHTDQLIMDWLIGSLSEDALKSVYVFTPHKIFGLLLQRNITESLQQGD